MIVAFTIFTGITVYLVYFNWYLINNNNNDDDDNDDKNKKLMNVIIKNGNIENFDAKLLKIEKKSYKDTKNFVIV